MRAALICLMACIIGLTVATDIEDLTASIAQHNANIATLNGIKADVKNIEDTIKCFLSVFPQYASNFATCNAAIATFNIYMIANLANENIQLVIDSGKLQALTIQTTLNTAVQSIGGFLSGLFGGFGKRSVTNECKTAAVLTRAREMYETAVMSAVSRDNKLINALLASVCNLANGASGNHLGTAIPCALVTGLDFSQILGVGKRDLENERFASAILGLVSILPQVAAHVQQGSIQQAINLVLAQLQGGNNKNAESEKVIQQAVQQLIQAITNNIFNIQTGLNIISGIFGNGKRQLVIPSAASLIPFVTTMVSQYVPAPLAAQVNGAINSLANGGLSLTQIFAQVQNQFGNIDVFGLLADIANLG